MIQRGTIFMRLNKASRLVEFNLITNIYKLYLISANKKLHC